MLSEISQSPKTNIVWFYLYGVSRIVKLIKQGPGRGGIGDLLFKWYRLFIWQDEKVLEIGYTTM